MNIIELIEKGDLTEIDIDQLQELADSQQALLRSARRVNSVMHGNPTYMNVAFTMRTAIEKAERLTGGPRPEEEETEKPLPETPET